MKKHVLSLEDDLLLEKKEWPVLRWGWCAMGLFVVCGALGFMGGGFFAAEELTAGDVSVKYDRWMRYSLDTELEINARQLSPDSSIMLDAVIMDKIRIEKISPEPQSVKITGNWLKYKFNSKYNYKIVFYMKPINRGVLDLKLYINHYTIQMKPYIYF